MGRIADELRQGERSKKKQRDEICTENCMTIRNGRIIKKRDKKQQNSSKDKPLEDEEYSLDFYVDKRAHLPDIKTILKINAKLHHEKKERTRIGSHSINKIYYPIARFCQSRPIIRKNKPVKMPTFNTVRRAYSITAKIFPKYEVKKREFKQDHYEEAAVPNEHSEMYPYFVDKFKEAEVKKNKTAKQTYPLLKIKKKESMPLFMIVKEMSEKSKGGHKNLVYRVSNSTASFNVKKSNSFYNMETTKSNLLVSKQNEQKSARRCARECSKVSEKNREHFLAAFDKSKGRIGNFYSLNSRSLVIDDDYKEKLTRTIRCLLQPVIEQEHTKYHELKTGKRLLFDF